MFYGHIKVVLHGRGKPGLGHLHGRFITIATLAYACTQSDDDEPTLDGGVDALKGVFDKFGMHS